MYFHNDFGANEPVLMVGSNSADVKTLQFKLIELGYGAMVGTADGAFGPKTQTAVKEFQKDNALPITGIADAQTWNTINMYGSGIATVTSSSGSVTQVPAASIEASIASSKMPSKTIMIAGGATLMGLAALLVLKKRGAF